MSAVSYLEIYLAPLLSQLQRADVTDIYINRPGELWVETLGGSSERHFVPDLDEALLSRLARQVASLTHQGISREHPLLTGTLPDGARVQIVAPPATRSAMAIAIRKHVSSDLSLDDYDRQGMFRSTRGEDVLDQTHAHLGSLYDAGEWSCFLRHAVRARKTIIVSGGTSTGKTTFVNALLREIEPSERLVLIEDAPELVVRHENAVGLLAVRGHLGEADVSADDLLIASLRMRPDRIILGELRGAEASTFLRAVNTGHSGSLTTVHADTPERAIEQLAMLVLQSHLRMQKKEIVDYLQNIIDVIVQLERRNGRRSVAQIAWFRRPTSHGVTRQD